MITIIPEMSIRINIVYNFIINYYILKLFKKTDLLSEGLFLKA
jgi:hypothetical protein